LIYIHRISDRRFSGIAGRNFKVFRELCGETSLKNVVLVTNMWGEVSHDVGEARERELASNFLKPALDKGAQMVRHHNTKQSANDVVRRIMNNHPVVLQIQRELVDQRKDITNTAAGEAVNTKLAEEAKRHEAELKKAQEEKARALRQKEEEAKRKMEEEKRKREEQAKKARENEERIALQRRQEMERAKLEAKRLEEEARMARKRADEEHQRQKALLDKRLAAEAAKAKAARDAMQQKINHLQRQVNHHPDSGGGCIVM
jgi:membrane protein involved in colicin uptake